MAAAVVEFNSVKRGRERHLWDLVNGHKGSPLETNGTVCGPVANHLRNDGDDARPGQKRKALEALEEKRTRATPG